MFLGITTTNGGPLQVINAGVGSSAMTTLPWALIPLVLVPTYLKLGTRSSLRNCAPRLPLRNVIRKAVVEYPNVIVKCERGKCAAFVTTTAC